jgi:hypothetical protein
MKEPLAIGRPPVLNTTPPGARAATFGRVFGPVNDFQKLKTG